MRTRVLYDFAINTGKLYEEHCTMARENAPTRLWTLYLRVKVLPLYRKECDEPYEGMSKYELDNVATDLRDYYMKHVKECDA